MKFALSASGSHLRLRDFPVLTKMLSINSAPSVEGIIIQNTYESIHGAKCFVRNALGKRPVFHRFQS